MKYLLLFLFVSPCFAAAPVRSNYENKEDIRIEFQNVYTQTQSKDFDIVNSTPLVSDMVEGGMVIYTTGSVVQLLMRVRDSIYRVNFTTK